MRVDFGIDKRINWSWHLIMFLLNAPSRFLRYSHFSFVSIPSVLSISYFSCVVVVWCCYDVVMMLLWWCLMLLWCCYDVVWCCYDVVMMLVWCCLVLLWCCYAVVMMLFDVVMMLFDVVMILHKQPLLRRYLNNTCYLGLLFLICW